MTYGEIRHRLQKLSPGIDLDLLDGWINDRYTEILDRLDWDRQEERGVIQTIAPYETGTITATKGSTSITGALTVWTSAMTGRMVRIAARNEYYEFTYASGTTGTLDRGYEGEDGSLLAYKISQNVYQLPANARVLQGIKSFVLDKDLERWNRTKLDEEAPLRNLYASPQIYAPYMDNASDPPRIQVEIYPIPHQVEGLPYWVLTDESHFTADGTSVGVLPWVRPGALIEGVTANIRRHEKDYNGADRYELQFEKKVTDMVRTQIFQRGPQHIGMARRFTRHRVARNFRGSPHSGQMP